MRRSLSTVLVLGCLIGLTLACYGRALFGGEQFAYRDAAHYYYPLYERVQQEWRAGRWPPLWEPEENAGMPLLGNPTAAVLYPGKLIFAAVSYPVGAKLYAVAHTLLAFVAMIVLCRAWGGSLPGAAIGALAYAFGGPILFQYCNIIFLVGAAWVPLGIAAADRWLRLGSRWGLVGLAVVLAMETLGGDPESAYLTGVCSGCYAVALAIGRSRASRASAAGEGPASNALVRTGLVSLGLVGLWIVSTFLVATLSMMFREKSSVPLVLPWTPYAAGCVVGLWGLVGLTVLQRWYRGGVGPVRWLVPMLGGLAVAAVGAGVLAAAQLLPVLEFTGQSGRAASGGPHDVYPFSLLPLRVVEFVWPNVFGTHFEGNRSWLSALPPKSKLVKVWVPTLYVGAMTVVLALGAARLRRGTAPWRVWMTVVAAVSLLAAFGEFTSPLFSARFFPEMTARFGPHDPLDTPAIRFDRQLRDGDGSVYWLLATVLPGFRQFRFPSKLLTFTVMAVAALAAVGWDDLLGEDSRTRRRSAGWSCALLFLTLVTLVGTWSNRLAMTEWLSRQPLASAFGPLDASGAFAEMQRGLVQGALVLGVALGLAWKARRAPVVASCVALVALSVDLASANARYVLTVPQALLEGTPEALKVIQNEEAKHPTPGPYRVHRVPVWEPLGWGERRSADRVREFVEWERGTLQPKYGIGLGVNYTMTLGVAELYDYEWYYGGFPRRADADMARQFNVKLGEPIIYYPRRAFDMWTTRYFVLPYLFKWTDEHRGIASFYDKTERVYPMRDAFDGPGGRDRELEWIKSHDYQVRRNLAVYPRAWVVHSARNLKSLSGMGREDRDLPMQEILFANDPVWKDATRTVYDPRQTAWVEIDDRTALTAFLRDTPVRPSEAVTVLRNEPNRVELDVRMETPGLVVLADVYYPGWTLTLDGAPAPIYRTNRIMRGAAVPSGSHRLVYSFQPGSFRIGLMISGAGLGLLAIVSAALVRRPYSALIRGDDAEPSPAPDPSEES